MENRLAKIISVVFNPLLIPTFGILLLFNMDTFITYVIPARAKTLVTIIVLINTAIAPFLAIIFMKRVGFINDLLLDKRNERLLPMIIGVLLYFFTYYILRQSSLPSLVHFYFLGATMLVIISLFITLKWKISLHMVSMGGLTGLLLVTTFLLKTDIVYLITAVILISGLVGTSRLILKLHTPGQVFAGFILGVSLMLLLYFFFSVY